ncbi:hypothetical protein SSX86_008929 [Deinandra increscens subsp. villosa]|uniref:BHLH domain-containing protein n=1 Tax=Deinandra increscens subsp. villosa TaxID=3103831 RepID=A0AAP0H7A3_9ASTR
MGIQGSEVNCSSEQLPNCFFNPNCVNSIDQRDPFESGLSSIMSSPANSHPGIQIPSAKFSTFGGKIEQTHVMESRKLSRVSSNQSFKTAGSQFLRIPEENKKLSKLSMELGDSMEESSVSETETGIKGQSTNPNGRKRKGKDDKVSLVISSVNQFPFVLVQSFVQDYRKSCVLQVVAEDEKEETDAKRSKSNEGKKSNEKSTEPPKDYIHVRARRGQATDSHSLAERVRREKISERMKFLQDLVPGCNKVTGKAVMLDEIINYVQSLQQQVEFLSMKLATVNPRMDESMESLLSKDMLQPQVSLPNNVNPFDTSAQSFPYGFQSQINRTIHDEPENQFSMNPLMAAMHRNSIIEASTFWENDLQSVVKMALGQDQPQGFLGQMKVEL